MTPTPVAPFTVRMTFTTQDGPESYVESFPADTPAECAEAYDQARFLLRTNRTLPALGYAVYGCDPDMPGVTGSLHLADVTHWEDACAVRDLLNRMDSELQTAAGIDALQMEAADHPDAGTVELTLLAEVPEDLFRAIEEDHASYGNRAADGLFLSLFDLESWVYPGHEETQMDLLRRMRAAGATVLFATKRPVEYVGQR